MQYELRVALISDVPVLEQLISISAHQLSKGDYTRQQIDAALKGVFGVDSQLIKDSTYYLITWDSQVVACGGWSYRATLFGNDRISGRDPRKLDPLIDAAKIRAFFVHPDHTRKGLGRKLLEHCENGAAAMGFGRFELGATLPGQRLYQVCGYQSGDPVDHIMENGLALRIIPMHKKRSYT